MIEREKYLRQLVEAKNNGFPKVITGIRRCGKSFLLKEIYREYLLSENIPENHIITIDLDEDKNAPYRDPCWGLTKSTTTGSAKTTTLSS